MATTKTEAWMLDPKVDDPNGYQHKFAEANAIRLHYVEEGKGPLVILLHGFPFLWYLWRHQIKALAASGYRVVSPDLRGYGQADLPADPDDQTMTKMAGDVVGLLMALGEKSAFLVSQDAETRIGYCCLQTRPELFRGLFMICAPPEPRGSAPVEACKQVPQNNGRPGTADVILQDIRKHLIGVYYSTSEACSDDDQWRALWQKDTDRHERTYSVPKRLSPFLSQQAIDYVFSEFTRRGIQGAINLYAALNLTWRATSFLDRAAAALASPLTTFPNLQENVTSTGVGNTPMEEAPADVNWHLLKFLKGLTTDDSQASAASGTGRATHASS